MRVPVRRHQEVGATALIVAVFVSSVALVAAAWVSEFGLAFSNKRLLQNAVDAAALGAAGHVRDYAPYGENCDDIKDAIDDRTDTGWASAPPSTTLDVAQRLFRDNLGPSSAATLDGVVTTCDPRLGLTVTVTAGHSSRTAIGRAAGTDEVDVAVKAAAVVAAPDEVKGVRPVAMPLPYAQAAARASGVSFTYDLEKGDPTCGLDMSVWGLLNLAGKNGAGGEDGSKEVMREGYHDVIRVGSDIEAQTGWKTSVVQELDALAGERIVVPVYDSYSSKQSRSTTCADAEDSQVSGGKKDKDNDEDDGGGASKERSFHIVGFVTIEVISAEKGAFSFKHVRFTPDAYGVDTSCGGEPVCDLGVRVVRLGT